MKIRPVGAMLFLADMTKPTVAFRNFANAPKITHKTQHRAFQPATVRYRLLLRSPYTIRDADMPSNAFVIIVSNEFAYPHKPPICFVIYVCRSTCISTAPTARIFVNSNTGDVYESPSKKSRWCDNPCDLKLNIRACPFLLKPSCPKQNPTAFR
jgi:hypothetical protein